MPPYKRITYRRACLDEEVYIIVKEVINVGLGASYNWRRGGHTGMIPLGSRTCFFY